MKLEMLANITHTIDGYEVKDLRWKPIDSIITGLVKCPLMGNNDRHGGFVSCVWRSNGKPYRDKNRPDLTLDIKERIR